MNNPTDRALEDVASYQAERRKAQVLKVLRRSLTVGTIFVPSGTVMKCTALPQLDGVRLI
jgi:hypothetical protein